MNWKIILQLSTLGLIMAFGTVSLIPMMIEPIFWVAIFVFSAYVIARVCNGKYFLNGFCVSLVNCFWIVSVHVLFAKAYTENHLQVIESMPGSLIFHPRLGMIVTGPGFGIVSGLVLGSFSWIASKLIKKGN